MRFNPSGKTSAAFILAAVILSLAAISYFHVLEQYELGALDVMFRLRPKPAVTEKIVIVEIGEDTIKKLGRFPFPRSYHSILINGLSEFGARAVLFDLFFSEEEDENDAEFVEAVKNAGNVYFPFVFDMEVNKRAAVPAANGYLVESIPPLAEAAKGTGHINIIPDIDGKFRRIPPFVKYNDRFYPYVSVLLSCDYLGLDPAGMIFKPGDSVTIGDRVIPLDERSDMIINYSGKWGQVFTHVSYADILQTYIAGITGQKPALDPAFFRDKICIVGLTATGTVDIHPNPFETLYPGVGIHGEIINAIVNKHFLRVIPKTINLLILIALGVFAAFVTARMRPVAALALLACAALSFIVAAVALFDTRGIVIDVIYPVITIVVVYLSSTIHKYAAELNRSLILANELGIAKKIQESFLPKTLPTAEGMSVAASMFTARQVGGDLYDFREFGADKLGVMIGDVSGKGVPASLFMAMVTGSFRSLARPDVRPDDVLAGLNSKILKDSASNLFVTIFYAVFDLNDKRVAYANGGHLPILYLAPGSAARFLDVAKGPPLGLIDEEYSSGEISFDRGDIFVFYTDGITEAMNPRRETYDNERLIAVIEKNRSGSPRQILEAVDKDVRKFEPKKDQHDDMTLIVIKIE